MPFDCFLNAYNANRYSSISLTERGVFDFLETLVYQLTSLEKTYQNPRFSSPLKKEKKMGKNFVSNGVPSLSSFFFFFFFSISPLQVFTLEERRLGRDRERNIEEEGAKKWTEEVEEDVNVSCSAPRNGSMILASRGVWAARRTSIVGPSPLKERRKGRSQGPEGGGGGSRGGGGAGGGRGPHTGPGVSPDARRSQSYGIRRELGPRAHTHRVVK